MNSLGKIDSAPDRAALSAASFRTSTRGSASILYVEDEPLLRFLSTLTLTDAGYRVTPVEDGLQAWAAIQSNHFDLLVTDNEMPRLTGLELVAKARREGMKLPIIMASRSATIFSGPDYQWLELAAFVQKPFAPAEMRETVRRILLDASTRRSNHCVCPCTFSEALHRLTPYQHWGLNE